MKTRLAMAEKAADGKLTSPAESKADLRGEPAASLRGAKRAPHEDDKTRAARSR